MDPDSISIKQSRTPPKLRFLVLCLFLLHLLTFLPSFLFSSHKLFILSVLWKVRVCQS